MVLWWFVGLVVKVSASRVEDPVFESRLWRDYSGLSHTSDVKIGIPVATLLGAWHYRVCRGTGQPSVSILWLGEVENLICSFYLSVASPKIVWADLSLRYTSTDSDGDLARHLALQISTRTSRLSASLLGLGEIASWACNFYLSVATQQIAKADLSLPCTRCMLQGC